MKPGGIPPYGGDSFSVPPKSESLPEAADSLHGKELEEHGHLVEEMKERLADALKGHKFSVEEGAEVVDFVKDILLGGE